MKAGSPQTIENALAELGMTDDSLKSQERAALDSLGYVVLESVFANETLVQLRDLFDLAVAEQRPNGSSRQKETGTRHIKDLHRAEGLWRVSLNNRILAAVFHILKRRFVCGIPHGREPLQGFGQQGLHMDWSTGRDGEIYYVATAICLLDDFTTDNGATRVVPGSHREAQWRNKKISDPAFIHPKQVTVTAAAGSVLCFNGHLLHSGTRSGSPKRRRTLQMSFAAYEVMRRIADDGQQASTTDPVVRYLLGYE
jgi:ectoine hydroxylase-related dioxygenase (phytanoyl-CoA dioxygenase family)